MKQMKYNRFFLVQASAGGERAIQNEQKKIEK